MSSLAALRFHTLHIPFRERFRHASAARDATSSVWVEAIGSDGQIGVGEACPRPYVTSETLESAAAFFSAINGAVVAEVHDADSLRAWVAQHAAPIDRNPAAWCAIELALIDLFARQSGQTAETWLGLPASAGTFTYSAVLGDADKPAFVATVARYREVGLRDFKLKLSGDVARDQFKIEVLRQAGADVARLRLDANNLWQDLAGALAYLEKLDAPAFAIEEPLSTRLRAELPALAQATGMAVILDESLCRIEELEDLARDTPWIPNLRVSKLGGVLRTLSLVGAAKARGLPLIVGAQVGETSLLTRVALIAARAAGDALLAQEGAFGTMLLERDVCTSPLMFGRNGALSFEAKGPGWGLGCAPDPSWLRQASA